MGSHERSSWSYSDILKCATDACRSGEKCSWHIISKLRSAEYQNHFPDRLIRYSSTLFIGRRVSPVLFSKVRVNHPDPFDAAEESFPPKSVLESGGKNSKNL